MRRRETASTGDPARRHWACGAGLAAALLAAMVLAGVGRAAPSVDAGVVAIRLRRAAEPGDLALLDLANAPIRLAEYRGRVVFLYAWTTWCPYCLRDIPPMLVATAAWRRRGLEVLLVNLGEPRQRVLREVLRRGYEARVALDPTSGLARLGVTATPTTLVVDRAGRLTAVVIGPRDWNAPAMTAWLDAVTRP